MYTKCRICEGVKKARGQKVMIVVTSQSMDSHTRQEPWATTELSGRMRECPEELVHGNNDFFFIMHGVVQVILADEGICASRGVRNVL